MSISSIGVQQILPQTGTGGQNNNPAPDRSNDSGTDDSAAKQSRAPASPGTGQFIDKVA